MPDLCAAPPLMMRPMMTLPSASLRTVAPSGSQVLFSICTTFTPA